MRRVALVMSLAIVVAGCAGHSLVPREQAQAIKQRHRALAPHSATIQETMRQSGKSGALAFLDAGDGRLVVLPGDTPAEAWARHVASPAARVSLPPVVTFVYRADVPKAPESVTAGVLQEQETLRSTLATLDTELRKLSESVATTRRETQASITTTRDELQKALDALAEDLATARKFMLQVAQLGWLNQEMNTENANAIRKAAAATQEASASSTKLAESLRELSEHLASQLKALAARLDAIQKRVSDVK